MFASLCVRLPLCLCVGLFVCLCVFSVTVGLCHNTEIAKTKVCLCVYLSVYVFVCSCDYVLGCLFVVVCVC